MGSSCPGHVNRVNEIMLGQVLADLAPAVSEPHKAVADEFGSDVLKNRSQVVVDGVHLDDHNLALDEHLREDIEQGDRRDVSRSEDYPNGALRLSLLVEGSHIVGQVRHRHPGLHPHFSRVSIEE